MRGAAEAIERAPRESTTRPTPASARSGSASASTPGTVTRRPTASCCADRSRTRPARGIADSRRPAGHAGLLDDGTPAGRGPSLGESVNDTGLFWLQGLPPAVAALRGGPGQAGTSRTGGDPRAVPPLTPFVGAGQRAGQPCAGTSTRPSAAAAGSALVAGEAGVGKSRLVARDRRRGRGARHGGAHRPPRGDGRRDAYLPDVEIIEQATTSRAAARAARGLGDAPGDRADRAGAEAGLPGHPAAGGAAARAGPPYLWAASASSCCWQRRASRSPGPRGLHWADESTVLLTEYLAPLLAGDAGAGARHLPRRSRWT